MTAHNSIQEQIEQMLVAVTRPNCSDYELQAFLQTIEEWVLGGKISRIEADRLIARLELLIKRLTFSPEQVEEITTDNLSAIDAKTLSVDLAEHLVSMASWVQAGVLNPEVLRLALAKVLASEVALVAPTPTKLSGIGP